MRGKLPKKEKLQAILSFEPRNLGIFTQTLKLSLLEGLYCQEIKVMGSSRSMVKKERVLRGPESTAENFKIERKFVEEEKASVQTQKKKTKEMSIPGWLRESSTLNLESGLKFEMSEKIDNFLILAENKEKANKFVRDMRIERENKQKKRKKEKMTSKEGTATLLEYLGDIDLNLDDGGPPSPHLALPTDKDPLWVIKSIESHEPYTLEAKKVVQHDENKCFKRKFKQTPTTQAEVRDSTEDLDGEKLQKIYAGPKIIDYGKVFVKSEETKYFTVTNDLRQYILVKIDADAAELIVHPKSYVIPALQTASFGITFKSAKAQLFKRFVTYSINERPFKFQIEAKAEPVILEPNRRTLKFFFSDELERTKHEYISLKNDGNSAACFKFSQTSIFKISPMKGKVASKDKMVSNNYSYCFD